MKESAKHSGLEGSELRSRILHCERITPDTLVRDVQELFTQTRFDFLMVFQDKTLVGLCSQVALGNLLASRYGWSLYAHKPIGTLAQRPATLIREDEPIPRILSRFSGREKETFYDDAVFVSKTGRVEGCIPMNRLIEFQHQIYASQIAELDEQREQVEQAREEAEEANKAKSRFLATMSHEIRTSMNGVIGMTDLMMSTQLDEEQQDWMSVIQSSAESLLDLINDILDLSKIEAGAVQLEQIPFELYSLTEECLIPHRQKAKSKGIRFERVIDPGVPEKLTGDPTRLRQVLNNLVGNALKLTTAGSVRVHISIRNQTRNSPMVHIAVRDTGIGVPKEKKGRLFQTFSQVDASHTRKFGGTGLGLAICKQLVEMQGGEIGVQSMEGEGSTFWFTLPLTQTPLRNSTDDQETSNRAPLTEVDFNSSILLVEDNPVNLMVAKGILKRLGFSSASVGNGQEALDYLDSHPVDLVFMDIQMPVMDGLEATKRQREREQGTGKHVPIIAMTANAMIGDREVGLAAGMDEYLTKPMKRDPILRMLETFLPRQNSAGHPTT